MTKEKFSISSKPKNDCSLYHYFYNHVFNIIININFSVILGHAFAKFNPRQDVFHFHQSPMSKLLGFRPTKFVTHSGNLPNPPEYSQIKASTLPRRSTSGS